MLPIDESESGNVIADSVRQPLKAYIPTVTSFSGKVTLTSEEQPSKQLDETAVRFFGITALASDEQFRKALEPISVTLSGITMPPIEVFPLKASYFIAVTGQPPRVDGITTSPYTTDESAPVIVAVPFATV